MATARLPLAGIALTLAFASTPAMAQDYVQSPRTYYLHPPSSYQQGCWGACTCPLTAPAPMRGSFTLGLITVGDATDLYSITTVDWTVPPLVGPGPGTAVAGSGTFGAGQVPFATHQHASLDLTFTPAPAGWSAAQHFDSTLDSFMRTVAPPVIDIEVANSTTGCPGIRMRIVASWYRSDFNGDGSIGISDVFAYLNAWFAGSAAAEFDGAPGLTVPDIFAFLNAWFLGA